MSVGLLVPAEGTESSSSVFPLPLFPEQTRTQRFLILAKENWYQVSICLGFPGGSVVKNLPADAGETGLIPGAGRSPGGGNGNPLQYSCLGNPMDRGAWRVTGHGVPKS